MTQPTSVRAVQPTAVDGAFRGSLPAGLAAPWLKPALLAFAVAAAACAFWITATADFLAHPGWLAIQKADFIVGPVLVGLCQLRVRPASRFGWLLIVLGLLGLPYILESSSVPKLFGIGVVAEDPIYVMTTIVILAFPTGWMQGWPERLVIAILIVTVLVVLVLTVNAAHLAPGLSISECRDACRDIRVGIASPRSWVIVNRAIGILPVAVALATAAVIVWRFATGTPPRRPALAIGAPIAVLFLL